MSRYAAVAPQGSASPFQKAKIPRLVQPQMGFPTLAENQTQGVVDYPRKSKILGVSLQAEQNRIKFDRLVLYIEIGMGIVILAKRIVFIALVVLLQSVALWAQPQTPPVYINNKYKLVELARSERATLRYDLRSIGGEYLKVRLYHNSQTFEDPPLREWLFASPAGAERISLEGLPLDVYTVLAFCSNSQGEPLALAAPTIHVEYGGWRAWEKFRPPVETVTEEPEGFEELEVSTNVRNRDVGVGVDPPAVVLKPGQTATFQPAFRNMEAEQLRWKLVGEGELKAVEDGAYLYTAPADQLGTQLFRIEVQSTAHPDLQGGATILVTNADPDKL